MTSITRRTALTAAPAVALTAAVPALAGADGVETPISVLFDEWLSLWSVDSRSEGEADAMAARMHDVACRLCRIEPKTIPDYARKIAVWYGLEPISLEPGGELAEVNNEVLAEMARLAGMGVGVVADLAPPESDVIRLFHEWRDYIEWTNGPQFADAGDDVTDRQGVVENAMADRMFALPSRDARDVLAKLLTLTLDGTVGFNDDGGKFSDPIVAEARAFVGTAPFLANPAVAPAAPATPPESEIVRLFREWKRLRKLGYEVRDDEADAVLALADDIENRVSATEPRTITDFALKIIMADGDDGMSNTLGGRELVAEAYRIAGVTGWSNEDEADLRDWRARIAEGAAA